MELTTPWRAAIAGFALTVATPAAAQRIEPASMAGVEVFYSTDSDGSTTVRAAVDADLRNAGPDERLGVRLEKAWYDPVDSGTRGRERAFVRWADGSGDWTWNALVGTDGHALIGAVTVHDNAAFRKEFFVERDVVETRRGLDEGIYSTFAGAALDVPLGDRTAISLVGGAQEFTGDNLRLHARANFIQVLKPDWGLSAQLRARYFHDSTPGEFDYYSPRWYAQVLPALQVRRVVDGWELVGVGGIGVQRDSYSDWHRADFAQFRFRSPANARQWYVNGDLTYSDAPANSAVGGAGYRYFQGRLGIMRRF